MMSSTVYNQVQIDWVIQYDYVYVIVHHFNAKLKKKMMDGFFSQIWQSFQASKFGNPRNLTWIFTLVNQYSWLTMNQPRRTKDSSTAINLL